MIPFSSMYGIERRCRCPVSCMAPPPKAILSDDIPPPVICFRLDSPFTFHCSIRMELNGIIISHLLDASLFPFAKIKYSETIVEEGKWHEIKDKLGLDEVNFNISLIKLSRVGLIKEIVGPYVGYAGWLYLITPAFIRLMKLIKYANEPTFNYKIR